jgi:3',5'-nucleoside bisphosphate phosphatase
MTPRAIVQACVARGLDVIAICDHNSARNTAATMRAAQGTCLTVFAGIEINTAEEVHILGVFRSDQAALTVQEEIYSRLPGENDETVFGYQVVVDEDDFVEDMDQRLLIGATTLTSQRVVDLIQQAGGVAIASHVDRQGFGIFSQLGFIPDSMRLDALEVSRHSTFEELQRRYPQAKGYSLVTGSDAHSLEDIGAAVTLAEMEGPSFDELRMALASQKGRRIIGRL